MSQNSYQMQMSIMQGLEEGFQGFQNIRVIGGPPKWYQVMRSPKLVPNNHSLSKIIWPFSNDLIWSKGQY